MKAKLLIIVFFLFFSVGAAFSSDSFKEKTESWGKRSSAAASSGRTDGKTPTDDPSVGSPVGDSLLYVLFLAGAYALFVSYRKSTRENVNC